MILSRVMKHLKEQHWIAVFLDFVVVVIGVFVGLQAQDWNNARADRARAHDYLERIGTDLDADIATYKVRAQFWGKVANYGAKALAYANAGDAGGQTQWQLLLDYFQASQTAEFYPISATYDELRSAGELRLIADTKLRSKLASYYINSVNPALKERPAYREHVREIIPVAVQNYIWTHCYGSNDTRQYFLNCDPPISNERASEIVNAIRNDKALIGELRYWMSTMTVASIISGGFTTNARSLRRIVSKDLGETNGQTTP